MAESDDGFVSRWSRRKREVSAPGDDARAPDRARAKAEAAPAVPPEGDAAVDVPPRTPVEELPDPETLTEGSDFTVFLKDDVPEALRRTALRRLWRLSPVFANVDGLNDYDGDFTDAATVVEGLKTLYKVGRGYAAEEDEAAPEQEASEAEADEPGATAESLKSDASAAPDGLDDAGAEPPDPEAVDRPTPAAPTAAPVAAAGDAAGDAKPGSLRRRGARERRWGGSSR